MQDYGRKQWKIVWCKSKKVISADLIGIVIILLYLHIMGVSINCQQLSKERHPYIRFEHVLKTNFLLQEKVTQLTAELTQERLKTKSYELKILEHQVAIDQQSEFMKKKVEDCDMLKETIATLTITIKGIAQVKQERKVLQQENQQLEGLLSLSNSEIEVLKQSEIKLRLGANNTDVDIDDESSHGEEESLTESCDYQANEYSYRTENDGYLATAVVNDHCRDIDSALEKGYFVNRLLEPTVVSDIENDISDKSMEKLDGEENNCLTDLSDSECDYGNLSGNSRDISNNGSVESNSTVIKDYDSDYWLSDMSGMNISEVSIANLYILQGYNFNKSTIYVNKEELAIELLEFAYQNHTILKERM